MFFELNFISLPPTHSSSHSQAHARLSFIRILKHFQSARENFISSESEFPPAGSRGGLGLYPILNANEKIYVPANIFHLPIFMLVQGSNSTSGDVCWYRVYEKWKSTPFRPIRYVREHIRFIYKMRNVFSLAHTLPSPSNFTQKNDKRFHYKITPSKFIKTKARNFNYKFCFSLSHIFVRLGDGVCIFGHTSINV